MQNGTPYCMRCDRIASFGKCRWSQRVKESKTFRAKVEIRILRSTLSKVWNPNTIRHNVYEFTEQFLRHLISAQATEKKLYQRTLDADISVTFLFRFCFVLFDIQ